MKKPHELCGGRAVGLRVQPEHSQHLTRNAKTGLSYAHFYHFSMPATGATLAQYLVVSCGRFTGGLLF